MEFWGVEVKPGETIKCEPGDDKYIHLSQASLGETKKANENVPLFVKCDNKKLVMGTLSGDKFPQIQYDLVFEKEFELSHSSKSASVYFCGYKTIVADDPEDMFDDDTMSDDSEEEPVEAVPIKGAAVNGKPKAAEKAKADAKKADASKSKPDDKPKNEDDTDESDDDSDEDEDDSDEEPKSLKMMELDDDEDNSDDDEDDSDEDDEDDSDEEDEEEEATPQKDTKKRSLKDSQKTPGQENKKAKLVSPAGGQKTDGKKGGHVATPHPAKQAPKTPAANNDKEKKPQTPKSAGSVACKSCSKTFNSENALQSHTKAKHG